MQMPGADSAAGDTRPMATGRWHWASVAAAAGGGLLVLVVQAIEGGALRALFQLPAALIVVGGTSAATLVSYSPAAIRKAVAAAWGAFREEEADLSALCAQLVTL